MGKHTQVSWTYGQSSNYVGYWIAPVGTLPALAAVERPRNNPDLISVECFNFPGETEAIARLIAAAPDLLAACKLTLSHLINEEAADAVRAAILKAGGFEAGRCRCCGSDQARMDAFNVEPQNRDYPWGWTDESRTLCQDCL